MRGIGIEENWERTVRLGEWSLVLAWPLGIFGRNRAASLVRNMMWQRLVQTLFLVFLSLVALLGQGSTWEFVREHYYLLLNDIKLQSHSHKN